LGYRNLKELSTEELREIANQPEPHWNGDAA
jgi:hypothetical protein